MVTVDGVTLTIITVAGDLDGIHGLVGMFPMVGDGVTTGAGETAGLTTLIMDTMVAITTDSMAVTMVDGMVITEAITMACTMEATILHVDMATEDRMVLVTTMATAMPAIRLQETETMLQTTKVPPLVDIKLPIVDTIDQEAIVALTQDPEIVEVNPTRAQTVIKDQLIAVLTAGLMITTAAIQDRATTAVLIADQITPRLMIATKDQVTVVAIQDQVMMVVTQDQATIITLTAGLQELQYLLIITADRVIVEGLAHLQTTVTADLVQVTPAVVATNHLLRAEAPEVEGIAVQTQEVEEGDKIHTHVYIQS